MDSVAARDFWNSRYDRQDYLFGEAPNAFLAAQAERLKPGMTAYLYDGAVVGIWQKGETPLALIIAYPVAPPAPGAQEPAPVSAPAEHKGR